MCCALLQVAATGAQLLARLRAVEAVAKFQAAGEALARMHASGAAPDTQAAQVCFLHSCPKLPLHVGMARHKQHTDSPLCEAFKLCVCHAGGHRRGS